MEISIENLKYKNQAGFSLVEVLVSILLFTTLVTMVISIFQAVSQGQRHVIAAQNVQEAVYFAFEAMSKEIRTARGDHMGINCGVEPYYKVFNTENATAGSGENEGSELYFQNQEEDCVLYYLDNNQLRIDRGGDDYPITPDDIVVNSLQFYIVDDVIDDFHSLQPRVTIRITVEAIEGQQQFAQPLNIETTVSSRYYE
jgi:prepilin-type N-terminal cleavage/methylation domain-containing protein